MIVKEELIFFFSGMFTEYLRSLLCQVKPIFCLFPSYYIKFRKVDKHFLNVSIIDTGKGGFFQCFYILIARLLCIITDPGNYPQGR